MANGRTIGQLVLEVNSDVTPALDGLQKLFQVVRDGISEFAQFQTGVNEVATLLGPDAIPTGFFDEAVEGARSLAFEFGTLTNDSIPALYQAISARVPRENAFSFLETANQAAIAGVTTLDTSVRGLAASINAYGRDVLSADEASDALFVGVRFGITTFEQLSNNIGKVSPLAANLGVTFDEVVASLAAMTAQGVSTSQATTRLNAVLTELSRESSEVSQVFRSLTGQSFPEFIASGGTMQEAINLLNVEAERTNTTMVDMFNRIEAGQGVMLLTGESANLFEDALGGMAEKSGATEAAFETMAETMQFRMNQLFASLEQVRLAFFRGFDPSVVGLIENILPIIEDLIPTFEQLGMVAGETFGIIGQSAFGVVENIQGPLTEALESFGELLANFGQLVVPLSEGLGSIAGVALEVLVPALTVVSEVVGNFAQILESLPTGIGGTIAALVLFRTQAVAAFRGAASATTLVRAGLLEITDGATRAQRALRGARLAAAGLGRALGGIVVFAAIEGITRLIGALGESAEEAEQRVENLNRAFEIIARDSGGLVPQLRTLRQAQEDIANASRELSDAVETSAFGSFSDDVVTVDEATRQYENTLGDIQSELGFTDQQMEAFVNSTEELSNKIRDLGDDTQDTVRELNDLALSGDVNIDEFNNLVEALELTDRELTSLASAGGPAYVQALTEIRQAQELGLNSTGLLDQELVGLAEQMGVTGEGAQSFAEETIQAWQTLAENVRPVGQLLNDTFDAIDERVEGFADDFAENFEDLDTTGLLSAFEEGREEFIQFAEDAGASSDEASAAFEEFSAAAELSLSDFNDSLQESVDAVNNFNENMVFAAQIGGQEFAEFLAEAGPEALQAFREGTEAEQAETIALFEEFMGATGEGAKNALELGLADLAAITGLEGRRAADALLEGVSNPEELQERADELSSILGAGFEDVAQLAGAFGKETANALVNNLTEGRRLSEEQISLLAAGTEKGLIDWQTIALTQGQAFADNLNTKLKENQALTDDELATLRRNTSSDMSEWANIAVVQGQEWLNNLNEKLATGEIDFSEYSAELERMARNTDADVETEVDEPPRSQQEAVFDAIAGFFSRRDVDVPSRVDEPTNIAELIRNIFIPTVIIPTQLAPPSSSPGVQQAHGGIHSTPTRVLVGEAYQQEVIIPLERPQRAQELAERSGLFDVVNDPNSGSGHGIIIQPGAIVISTPLADPALVAEQVMDRLAALSA